jgi:hypothetical protein
LSSCEPFDWLQDRISRLERLAAEGNEPCEWLACAKASEEDIFTCEQGLGFPLSPGHRAFLRKSNGAQLSVTWRPGESATFLILDTRGIVERYGDLQRSYDAKARPRKPGALWGRLIPVIDCQNFEYCVAEPEILTQAEYAILFASNELGPEWWRRYNYIAPSFEILLLLMIDRVVMSRQDPQFWTV